MVGNQAQAIAAQCATQVAETVQKPCKHPRLESLFFHKQRHHARDDVIHRRHQAGHNRKTCHGDHDNVLGQKPQNQTDQSAGNGKENTAKK